MQIDKQQVTGLLKSLGQHDRVGAADAELPDRVDTDTDSGLLDKLGINGADLAGGAGGSVARWDRRQARILSRTARIGQSGD